MLKSSRAAATFALAMSLSSAVFSPASANEQDEQRPANDYMIATDRDMRKPDRAGFVIVKREAKKVVGCTSDDQFLLTYIFAQTRPQDVNSTPPAKVNAYLNRMHNTIMTASRYHSAAIFEVGNRYPITLPPDFYKRLEAASYAFNKANGTHLNWMMRVFTTSGKVYQPCVDYRLKNPLPANN